MRRMSFAQDQLARHATTDDLTGLLTRAAFIQEVEEELADARFAEDGMRGTLLIIDADDFKSVNDRFGHDEGDTALQLLARAIRSVLRAADRVGRIGGEEFAVFLPATSPFVGEAVAERIRVAVNKLEFAPQGQRYPLTVTVGGATYDRYLSFVDLFRLADQQLYVAKRNGRNRTAVSPIKHYETLPAACLIRRRSWPCPRPKCRSSRRRSARRRLPRGCRSGAAATDPSQRRPRWCSAA